MKKSLFLRVFLPLTAGISICWIIFFVIIARANYIELYEFLDHQMIQTAKILTVPMDYENFLEPRLNLNKKDHNYEYNMHYVVWNKENTTVFADQTADVLPSSFGKTGFYKVKNLEKEYIVYTYHNPKSKLSASAGYPTSINKRVIIDVIKKFWLPWILGLFSLGVVNLICLRLGLKPLYEFEEEVHLRDPNNLNAFETEVPNELKNFKIELNRLIEKIRNEIEKERRFTADAAHELKTPLTAIKVQTEILSMDLENDSQKKQTDKIILGVDRMNHIVEQMLILTRLDNDSDIKKAHSKIDFHKIFYNLTEEFPSKYLSLDFQRDFILQGDPFLIGILFKNLIENSIKYSTSDVEIILGVSEKEFSVKDNGTGINAEFLQRVRERFFRPSGQKMSGSGLGLSIIEKIAHLHGLEMKLESKPSAGLKVSFF